MKKFYFSIAAVFAVLFAHAQCQADFGYTNAGNVFSFSDSSTTSSGNISTWFWQFGDNTAPSTAQNPQHTYDACGYYEVTLTIFTSSFCTSTFTDTVYVTQGTLPTFTFTVDTTTGDVTFNSMPASTLLTYSWNFGDSNVGSGQNVVHTYDSAGTYVACLTIADTGMNCVYSICDTVVVYIAPATCNATWTNQSIIAGQQTFTATPINLGWTYTWDYGDASAPGNGFVSMHTYATAGTYTVCLTIYDSATACTSQFCDTVQVVFPASCPVSFTNLYLAGNMTFTPTPLGPLNTYVWDFGDATAPFTGLLANHTYAAPGTYTVCVTMTTFQGCTSTFCDTVIVPSSIGIAENSSAVAGLNVAPNPATENVIVTYALANESNVTIELVDVTGRVVAAKENGKVQAGEHREDMDVSTLAPGLYFVRIVSDNGSAQVQLIRE